MTALNAIPRLVSDYPGRNVVDAAVSNQDFPRAYRKPQENVFVDGMSVDLEDYFQVEAFASRIPRSAWPFIPSRIRSSTSRVLELLERNQCRATFFVLGWVAEREPSLIREIAQAGHELACHSHLHRPLHHLSQSEFRENLRKSRGVIEDASGMRVVGFRAPTFSITNKSLWALEILAEEGFEYDSSIFPIRHDLYGIPSAPRWIHQETLPSGGAGFKGCCLAVVWPTLSC